MSQLGIGLALMGLLLMLLLLSMLLQQPCLNLSTMTCLMKTKTQMTLTLMTESSLHLVLWEKILMMIFLSKFFSSNRGIGLLSGFQKM